MKLSTEEILNHLFDAGTFVPHFEAEELGASALVGKGTVNGETVYLIADRPLSHMDDMGANLSKKSKYLKLVREDPHPVVIVFDKLVVVKDAKEAGAAFIMAPGVKPSFVGKEGFANYYSELAKTSGHAPIVGFVVGGVAGGFAFPVSLCDIAVFTQGSSLALARPDVVRAVTGKKIDAETLGGAKVHCSVSGIGDKIVQDDAEGIAFIKRFLGYFPPSFSKAPPVLNFEKSMCPTLSSNFAKSLEDGGALDVKELINQLMDRDSFVELKESYATEVVLGLGRIDGRVAGFVISNSAEKYGAIFPESCRKVAKFISLCDSFSVPLVFLADTPGFMIGQQVEHSGAIKFGAQAFALLATTTVPKIFVVLRKAFGGAIILMGGPGFADHSIALPSAKVGPYASSAAIPPRNEREQQGFNEVQDMCNSAVLVEQGFFDSVVEWERLRDYLITQLSKRQMTGRSNPKAVACV